MVKESNRKGPGATRFGHTRNYLPWALDLLLGARVEAPRYAGSLVIQRRGWHPAPSAVFFWVRLHTPRVAGTSRGCETWILSTQCLEFPSLPALGQARTAGGLCYSYDWPAGKRPLNIRTRRQLRHQSVKKGASRGPLEKGAISEAAPVMATNDSGIWNRNRTMASLLAPDGPPLLRSCPPRPPASFWADHSPRPPGWGLPPQALHIWSGFGGSSPTTRG